MVMIRRYEIFYNEYTKNYRIKKIGLIFRPWVLQRYDNYGGTSYEIAEFDTLEAAQSYINNMIKINKTDKFNFVKRYP